MKKLIAIGATGLIALVMLVGLAPAASAYPETTCNTTVDAQTVVSEGKVHVHGTVDVVVTDDGLGRKAAGDTVHWIATFNGETHTADENVFDTTFDVPAVTKTTTFVLHVEAIMPDEKTTCQRSLNITVKPSGTVSPPDNHPHLPDTGGPRALLLIAGLGLVVVGAVSIRMSRREQQRSGRHAH